MLRFRWFFVFHVSQGSVATYVRYAGSLQSAESVSERIFIIGYDFTAKVRGLVF